VIFTYFVVFRMFKSVRSCPQQFDLPESKIRPFEKILINYETQLLSGVIFQVNFCHTVHCCDYFKTMPYVYNVHCVHVCILKFVVLSVFVYKIVFI